MATPKPNSLADYIPNTLFSLSGQNAVVVGVGGLGKMAGRLALMRADNLCLSVSN